MSEPWEIQALFLEYETAVPSQIASACNVSDRVVREAVGWGSAASRCVEEGDHQPDPVLVHIMRKRLLSWRENRRAA